MFSSDNWAALPISTKDSHSLSDCKACAMDHDFFELQLKFPGLPSYKPDNIVQLTIPAFKK